MSGIGDIYDEHVWRIYAFLAYRLGSREDAEDLTQATFERAVRAFSRYDSRRASAVTWLLAIAQNLLIDHYRRQPAQPPRPLEDEELERFGPSTDPIADVRFGPDPDIAAALDRLSDRDREVVALRYGADLTGPEIAQLTGLTLVNVQQILSRSLRRMRGELKEREAAIAARRRLR